MELINNFLKILPVEITAGEFIAIVLFVSIIIGIFEASHNQAKKAEEFYKEKNEVYLFTGEQGTGMSLHAVLPNQSEKEREANGIQESKS